MSYELISQIEFEADAINLKVIRNNLRHIFSEYKEDAKTADDMVIALNEACMNIIQHAYSAKTSQTESDALYNAKKILIIIEKNDQHWRFELIDFAPMVDIKGIQPRDLNEVRPGGLGVAFIQKIMDKVTYENIVHKQHQGNRLILIKNTKVKV